MRTFSKALIISCIIGILSSCSVYKEYQKTDMPLVDSLFAANSAADSACFASVGWGTFFTDPLLQRLIEQALSGNTDLRIAALRVDQAKALLGAAKGAFFPALNLSPSGGMTYSNERFAGNANSYSLPLTASWEINLGGKELASKRKAKAALQKSELLRLSVQTELVSAVAECYYTLLKLDAQLEVSRSTAASWKENVRIMKAMKKAGMTNEASVARTEANSCGVDASLYDFQYAVRCAENSLAVLIGCPPQHFERSRLCEAKLEIPSSDNGVAAIGLPAGMLGRRPDLMAAEAALREAFYGTQVARASFYPSVTLTGEAGWEKALTSPAGWLFSLGAGMLQPIFAKGRIKANLKVSLAQQEEAIATMRAKMLVAGKEVNDAIALCQSAQGKADVRSRQIEALVSAVESTQKLMHNSGSTYLEVLTAQQALLAAQLQQITDQYEALSGSILLYKALGGGTDK